MAHWTTCSECGRVLTVEYTNEHGPICPDCMLAKALRDADPAKAPDNGKAAAPKAAAPKKGGCGCG